MNAGGKQFARRCCGVYLLAFLGWWAFGFEMICLKARWMHRSPVEVLFFQNSAQRFSDLTAFDPATKRLQSGTFSAETVRKAEIPITDPHYFWPSFCYPAAGMASYLLFAAFPDPITAFLLLVGAFALAAGAALFVTVRRAAPEQGLLAAAVLVSVLLPYPLMFLVERGNIEAVVWAAQLLGLVAFVTRRYWSAGLLLALAAAMKVYPGIFLILLLLKKRYKETAVALAALALFNVLSLRMLGPTIAQANAEIQSGLRWMNGQLMLSYRDGYVIAYDHSLFAAVKQLLNLRPHNPPAVDAAIHQAALPYLAVAGALFAILYWVRLRKLPLLNQIAFLTVVEITLPYMSQEYTLVHLYFPWALFLLFLGRDVASGRATVSSRAAVAVCLAFAFLFAPTPHRYFMFSIVGQLQLAALIILAVAMAAAPMRSSLFDELA